jgi:hypothetical protein
VSCVVLLFGGPPAGGIPLERMAEGVVREGAGEDVEEVVKEVIGNM